ncbi:MAG: aminoglycoside adenylyltransferase domain-containing protein [Candidatus Promineifilaceae bacterium]
MAGARAILGGRFVGLYLYGSLASGGFEPGRSDVDFLVVSDGPLPAELTPALQALHSRLGADHPDWAARLEGSYIPRPALRRHDPAQARHLHLAIEANGQLRLEAHASDWIFQRHILREQGVVLAGPPPATFIDPVGPADLRRAVLDILAEWWAGMPADPAPLQGLGYPAYAVLTMCRALYTLEHGALVTKAAAARWAQQALGPPWADLIGRALAGRPEDAAVSLAEALDFIRFTLARSREVAAPAGP